MGTPPRGRGGGRGEGAGGKGGRAMESYELRDVSHGDEKSTATP